jgi:hypothetical protein
LGGQAFQEKTHKTGGKASGKVLVIGAISRNGNDPFAVLIRSVSS